MATSWRVALGKGGEGCGAVAGCVIPEGELVQVVRLRGVDKTRLRCEPHAIGARDEEAIAQARVAGDAAREAQQEREAMTDAAVPTTRPTRVVPRTPVKSFASMSDLASTFDPKLAQLGERD